MSLVRTMNLQDACTEALVVYLRTALPSTYTVRRGWPEFEADAQNHEAPYVAVVPRDDIEEWQVAPAPVAAVVDPDDATQGIVTYCIGQATMEWEIQTFAPYKATARQALLAVEDALNPDIPYSTGLTLTLAEYFDQRVKMYKPDYRVYYPANYPLHGVHQRPLRLRTNAEILATQTLPLAAVIQLNLTVGSS